MSLQLRKQDLSAIANCDEHMRIWEKLVHGAFRFPEELPGGQEDHLVQLTNGMPTLLLTDDVFSKLCQLAREFNQHERLEAMVDAEISCIDEDIRIFGETLGQQRDKLAEMEHVVQLEARNMNTYDHDRPQYNHHDIEELQQHIRGLEMALSKNVAGRDRHLDELRNRRKWTLRTQRTFWEFVTHMLETSGFEPSKIEQWVRDRRRLNTRVSQNIHKNMMEVGGLAFAREHLAQDWEDHGENGTAETRGQGPADGLELDERKAAINEFEICHWNRRVARDDFENREGHAYLKQQHAVKKHYLLPVEDANIWLDLDHEGARETIRLTQNLMHAEEEYRDAVRKLRHLGQEVDTVDSSHFSNINTQPPTQTSEDHRLLKERWDFDIAVWRAGSKPKDCASASLAPTIVICKTCATQTTMSLVDPGGFSVRACESFGTETVAARKRAWSKEKARRDRVFFSQRKRRENTESADSDVSKAHTKTSGGIHRRRLANHRRREFPAGPAPPKFH